MMNNIKEKSIHIISEGEIASTSPITIHINYNESLTLKELSDTLDCINKSINDINREKGIKSNAKLGKEYATKVSGVDSGSIIIHIITNVVAPVALSMLASYLYDRLKNNGSKGAKNENKISQEDTGHPIIINVNGDNNLIELNITKPNN